MPNIDCVFVYVANNCTNLIKSCQENNTSLLQNGNIFYKIANFNAKKQIFHKKINKKYLQKNNQDI